MSHKIVIITPYVIPRRIDFYNKLYEKISNSDYKLKFLLIKEKPNHRKHQSYTSKYKFNYTLLKTIQFYFSKKELAIDFSLDLFKNLIKENPDTIILEGFGFAYIPAYIYAKYKRIKLVFWNKSSSYESIKHLSGISFLFKKQLFKLYDNFISGGLTQGKYLTKHGIEKDRIFYYNDTINTVAIRKKCIFPNTSDNKLRIIFIGELINRKGLNHIFEALRLSKFDYKFSVIGDGNLRTNLETKARLYNISCEFFGYIEPINIIKFLDKNDVCVVPSNQEPWGIVVEEALSAGLQVIVSEFVGARERIKINKTGFQFKNAQSLSKILCNLHKNKSLIRNKRSENSKIYCKEFNLNNSTHHFFKNIKSIINTN
jgi:glycosyltransferase involved in cell wall biosynthesis